MRQTPASRGYVSRTTSDGPTVCQANVTPSHDEAATAPAKAGRQWAYVSRAELVRLLRRTGYTADLIDEIAAQLPDPVEVDREWRLLERYGITRGLLMERMGASP